MKCAICKATATKKVIWADGRAYQPSCDQHVQAVKDQLTAKNGKMTELAGVQDLSDLMDLVDSHVYPKLERVPGIQNWVDKAGGLPDYIERIAKHLHYEKGMSISRAIAVAVNTVKRWARMGKVAKHGDPNHKHVTAKTAALAAAAVAEWNAKRKAGSLNLSDEMLLLLEVSTIDEEYALLLAEDLLDDEGQVLDLAVDDTRGVSGAGATQTQCGTLLPMDIQDLAERANRIEDPAARAAARQQVLDLAVPAYKLTAEKRRGYAKAGVSKADGSFPIFDRVSLKSAIGLARTPADRRHCMKRARALGLASMIPSSWSVSLSELAIQGIVDLASTIAPRNAHGRVSDGRRSYKHQGKFKHGFIPLDQAAKEAKAKGSPIAIKRLNRLYGSAKGNVRASKPGQKVYRKAATGRAGQRTAPHKVNPKKVRIDEKTFPGSEGADTLGNLQRSPFDQATNKNVGQGGKSLPSSQKEASKSTRVPTRATQNWDEIPDNVKTVRNGKRYVLAEFGGKGYVTPWVGGVQGVSGSSLDKRKVYRTLAPADAAAMTSAQLRDVVNNPKTSDGAKTEARRALKAKQKVAKK